MQLENVNLDRGPNAEEFISHPVEMTISSRNNRAVAQAKCGEWFARNNSPKAVTTLRVRIHDPYQQIHRDSLHTLYQNWTGDFLSFTDGDGILWKVRFLEPYRAVHNPQLGDHFFYHVFVFDVYLPPESGSLPANDPPKMMDVSETYDTQNVNERAQAGDNWRTLHYGPRRRVFSMKFTQLSPGEMTNLLGLCNGSFREGDIGLPIPLEAYSVTCTLDQDQVTFTRRTNYYVSSELRFREVV